MTASEKVSKYFTYGEVTRSDKRYGSNEPNSVQLENIKHLANTIMDPCREFVNAPLGVHSVYRSPGYNAAIGGDPNSQHMTGEAADIDVDIHGHGDQKALFDYIKHNLLFDVLIWEFGDDSRPDWIHVSCRRTQLNRGIIRRAIKENGVTRYIQFA